MDFSLLSRKQVCPKGDERRMSEETFPESFGKIETPRRVLKRYQSPLRQTTKGFGRDEFYRRIFLIKVKTWAILGG